MSVSYWQDTGGIRRHVPVDVVIVGAGLAGLSTAYWLHKLEPTWDIAIVDKGTMGSGASGRNAGFITCGSTEHFSRMTSAYGANKAEEIWKFTEYNHKLMIDTFGPETLKKECEWKQEGSWTLAATNSEIEVIGNTVQMLWNKGVTVQWHGPHELPKEMRGFYGGAYYKDDGEIHPIKYLNLLRQEAGASIWTNHEFLILIPQRILFWLKPILGILKPTQGFYVLMPGLTNYFPGLKTRLPPCGDR